MSISITDLACLYFVVFFFSHLPLLSFINFPLIYIYICLSLHWRRINVVFTIVIVVVRNTFLSLDDDQVEISFRAPFSKQFVTGWTAIKHNIRLVVLLLGTICKKDEDKYAELLMRENERMKGSVFLRSCHRSSSCYCCFRLIILTIDSSIKHNGMMKRHPVDRRRWQSSRKISRTFN